MIYDYVFLDVYQNRYYISIDHQNIMSTGHNAIIIIIN